MKVTILTADDWEALYFDDKLISQEHSIDAGTILTALQMETDYPEVNYTEFEKFGQFPDTLSQCKKDKII